MRVIGAVISAVLLLSACASGYIPSVAQAPDSYKPIQTAKYKPADQLRFMDCVYDGFLQSQGNGFQTFLRQVKRADGYLVDVSGLQGQYLVAEFKDDGGYRLLGWTDTRMIPVGRETTAAAACVAKFSSAQ
ncbi:hypothetical protein [Variovorax boronicumulans]|uniref:hypothetical protein n=1 Tax=Variovorax boronicumulans TaxID=436515 RepID=UPI00278B7F91|nr:hypothetical protein [Variovorax boronicumulans]MDQ0040849.1 hypothetical protein [Variovorax boronicumulans]